MEKMILTPVHTLRYFVLLLLFAISYPLPAQWTIPVVGGALPNSAIDLQNDCFELTSTTNQRGVVWNNTMMDISQPFDITLNVWHNVHGADGIAFVLQNTGLNAVGAGGNAHGFGNAVPPSAYPPIIASIAVELDLFDNGGAGVLDIPADHIAIHVNGDITTTAAGPSAAIPNGNPIPDNQCFPLRITWNPAPVNTMEIYWNNQLRLSWTNDIVANFFASNPNVFWGITGSCGSVQMTQRVCVGANFAVAGPDRSICLGDTVHLNASGGTTFLWGLGFPNISNQNIPNPVFSSVNAQNFAVPLTVTNLIGCIDRDTVLIQVRDTPSVSIISPPSICPGDTAQILATTSGGTAPINFLWNTGATTAGFDAFPAVTTNFSVTVTDANGCSTSDASTLVVSPLESLDLLDTDTALCQGAVIPSTSVTNSFGIDTYSWTPSTGVSSPNSPATVLAPTASTTYYITGTNSVSGCSAVDSIHIDVFDLNVSHFTDTIVCFGDSLGFNVQPTDGSGDYTVVWTTIGGNVLNDDSIPNPSFSATNSGTYVANIEDNISHCTAVLSIDVEVFQVNVIVNPSSILINPGQRVQLNATGAVFYSWEPDTMLSCANCPDPVSMPSSSITYTVTGTDTNGCTGTATATISTDSLLIPNVFSPNGDGFNDILELNYYGGSFYEISVFDRWGVLMFQTTDKAVMWNGTNKQGSQVPEGVYYLVVRVIGDEAIPAKDKQRIFAVTLMR